MFLQIQNPHFKNVWDVLKTNTPAIINELTNYFKIMIQNKNEGKDKKVDIENAIKAKLSITVRDLIIILEQNRAAWEACLKDPFKVTRVLASEIQDSGGNGRLLGN